jgi:hypothetical protein
VGGGVRPLHPIQVSYSVSIIMIDCMDHAECACHADVTDSLHAGVGQYCELLCNAINEF